jgi:hypothetical protein
MAITRRAFVGGSAAAVGTVVAAPSVAGADDDSPPTPEEAAAIGTPFLVQAIDPENATFEILIGEDAVPFTDRKLARTLARLAEESR